jgi:hypothetical protein
MTRASHHLPRREGLFCPARHIHVAQWRCRAIYLLSDDGDDGDGDGDNDNDNDNESSKMRHGGIISIECIVVIN